MLQSFCPKTSTSSQFPLFYQSEKRRLAPGKCCFNSAFCTDYSMKGGEQTEEKQWMWAFLIHSARSNKISPVTVAHMHGIAWYGQIWQTLTQNTLDVHVHVEEDTGKHLQSVTNFVTFCLPEEGRHPLCSGCKVGFSVSSSSPIYFKAAKRSRKTNFSFTKPMVALSLKITNIMKSSRYKD